MSTEDERSATMDDSYDNDGEGRCPVCSGWVSAGVCGSCGEDFKPKNPIPGADHFYDWCWCDPRIEAVHAR